MNSNLDKIIDEIGQFPELKDKLHQEIREYFDQKLRETNGEITHEVLRDADRLYDLPATFYVLIEALQISSGELQSLLGRERVIKCENCGTEFRVLERRRKGGYTPSGTTLCKICLREQRQESYERSRDVQEEAEARWKAEIELDARLIALSVEKSFDTEYAKGRLLEYVKFWLGLSDLKWPYWYHQNLLQLGFMNGNGCMICGCLPVRFFITQDDVIDKENDTKTTLNLLVDYWQEQQEHSPGGYTSHISWAPLIRPLQLFCRMSPGTYFGNIRFFPLLEMPLLLLCDKHTSLIHSTHFEPYPEWIFSKRRSF